MSDLISRQTLLEDLQSMGKETDNIGRYIDMIMLYEVLIPVKYQPVAYDVDKVLEQLKELAKEHEYKVMGNPDTYSEYNEAWEACCDMAIEIVKRGGINEV